MHPGKPTATFPEGDPDLPLQDQITLTTGGTGSIPKNGADIRIPGVNRLPSGPFQQTGPTLAYDAYEGDTIHQTFQMWQQNDCSIKNATREESDRLFARSLSVRGHDQRQFTDPDPDRRRSGHGILQHEHRRRPDLQGARGSVHALRQSPPIDHGRGQSPGRSELPTETTPSTTTATAIHWSRRAVPTNS